MADLTQLEQRWHVLNDDMAWAPLYPPPAPTDLPLYEIPFSVIIVVRSKSNTPTGRAAHNHLLGVLRGEERSTADLELNRDELLDIPAEYGFTLLRTNAEIPANPIHHLFVFGVIDEARSVAGFDWKHDPRAYE
jgi:hypothetical protein